MQLLRIFLISEVERQLLHTIRVLLLPPELDEQFGQGGEHHAQAMNASMATTADSNKVAILRDARPTMMDGKRAFAAPWTTTHLTEAPIPYPDPFTMAGEEAPIKPVPRVAAPAESPRRNRTFSADPTPQVPLSLSRGHKFRYLLTGRHTCCRKSQGLVSQQFWNAN